MKKWNNSGFFNLRPNLQQSRKHYNQVRPHGALSYRQPAPASIVPMDQIVPMS